MAMNGDMDSQEKIRQAALEIYSAMSGRPPAFDTKRWMGKIMEWAMKNEDFKIQLFRFIDLLPSLRTDTLVVRLLNEYFGGRPDMPKLISGAVSRISRKGFMPAITARMIRKGVGSIAGQFIAGSDPEDAYRRLYSLRQDGTDFSIDLLGEVVVSDKEAADYAQGYLSLLDFLHLRFPGINAEQYSGTDISVKASSFYSQLDPVDWEGSVARAKDGLRPVLRKAKAHGISVTFDMEHFYYKDLIIGIFRSVFEEEEFREGPRAGIALQAYLRDAEEDLTDLISWAREKGRKISVRLVKGAYWDYEIVVNRQKGWPVPVFLSKGETDSQFERLAGILLENTDCIRPAIATHNLRSMSAAIVLAGRKKISKNDFEFQMLFGMAEPLRRALRKKGFRIRVYTPVGALIPGMAYLVRRLLENTSNESFLRKSFGERTSFEDLVGQPEPEGEAPPAGEPKGEFRNEPPLDFSVGRNRKKMAEALAALRQTETPRYPLCIGSREVFTDREILSINPADPEKTVGRVSSSSRAEADAAIEEAIAATEVWRRTGGKERAQYLFRAADEMRKIRFELAALEVCEVGKTWKDADGDVAEAIDYLEYYGREMTRLAGSEMLGDYPGEENEYLYRPKGICAVISPWNFPLAIAAGMTSAAIVTGNCVIFKPSGLSPVTGYSLFDVFRSAGLPPGVLQFLPGPGTETGEYLATHPSVDIISFTGSKDVGLRLVELAGKTKEGQRNVKRVIAEMGGKNAVIVDETADLDEAVKGIIESAFGFQGQKCSACSRVIAVGEIFGPLCERLSEAAASIRIGPPEQPGNFMGPVISEEALRRIRGYTEFGKKEGTVIYEGHVPDKGFFAGPVLIADVTPDARTAREEIFGPVLAIEKAKDFDDGIRIANESLYALTGGLFSRSPFNIARAKNELRCGNLYINRKITGALVGRQPFGGFAMSGVGSKAGGPDYLMQFMNPVCISENTLRRGFAPLRKETLRR